MDGPDLVKVFRARFFSMSRLSSFPWTVLEKDLEENKSPALIMDILQQTCLHSLCHKFPPSIRFRRLFLTELIRRQEAADHEPLDELYDALAEVVGAEDSSECYKSYFLPGGDAVSLLENVAVISEGTTGLVTWEAALYLAEWALDHQEVFSGRTVLELGSGVGLTAITVARCCSPSSLVLSDLHPAVLQRLATNLSLNGLTERSPPAARVQPLDWTDATEDTLRRIGADVVIAADVVYDPSIVGSLVRLLSMLLTCSPGEVLPEVFICSTVRNPDTYGGFKQQLEKSGISAEVVGGPVSHVFPYSRDSAIELIRLHR